MAGFVRRWGIAIAVAAVAWLGAPGAAQAQDACPNGWSPSESVEFAPPVPAIDSGVANPERADGCTLLDEIWEGEPFASHGSFVAHVADVTETFPLDAAERNAIVRAAARSGVGGPRDAQLDNSCDRRLAITFDDGTSFQRPRTLQVLREAQVHGNFFDNGFRVAANPQIARFQVREGHTQLNHTYNHVNMSELSDEANREEVLRNEEFLASIGAPLTFKGIRPPFGGSNPRVQALLDSMGYTSFMDRIGTDDWLPQRSAAEIRDAILEQLHPGAIVALHDGPVDTPAGPASVAALEQIIAAARAQGYCFGVVDQTGEVVADRYVSSGEPIAQVVNPVPYHPLVFGTEEQIEGPYVITQGEESR